jgi:glycosyltransferase involved in cell wall biosynthesis
MEAVARPARDGRSPEDPIILLSVGRAVEKKGFDVLLHALARLPPMVSWRLAHIGAGTALGSLQRLARELGIASRIRWHGAQPQPKVIEQYRQADLFVLACRVARDGDRDGLPNVLMEAQSFGLACLSTRVAAIPELIIDGETGVLVPPDDPAALADALRRLISRPEWRQRLAAAGLRRVQSAFSFDAGIDQLVARFTQAGRVEDVCASRSMRR